MANPVANPASYSTPTEQVLYVGQGEFIGRGTPVRLRSGAQVATFSSAALAFSGTAVAARLRARSGAGSINLAAIDPATITTLTLIPTITATAVPVTFAHPFKAGEVPAGTSVEVLGKTTQFNVLSTYADGSVRHASITAITDTSAGVPIITSLRTRAPVSGVAISKADVLASAFSAAASLVVGGTTYTLAARDLLDGTLTPLQDVTHLSGPQCSEFIVGARVRNGGTPHAHLAAYFHIRAYGTTGNVTRVRVSIVIENGFIDAASPNDFTYNVTLSIGGSTVFTQSALVHFTQARWVKNFWWGTDPQVYVKHDHLYLQDTKMVPKYIALSPTETDLNNLASGLPFAPMAGGDISNQMSATGPGSFIGPVPAWTASYLLTGDKRAFDRMCANGEAGGSWGIHHRDELTGYPIDVDNRTTTQLNIQGSQITSVLIPDDAHQPSLAAVPYMVTGDYYYLEELHFWNGWNIAATSVGTRVGRVGGSGQTRGYAWCMRTLAQAAALTPDAHYLKTYCTSRLTRYLDAFYDDYIIPGRTERGLSLPNTLGVLADYDDIDFGTGLYDLARAQAHPWMDDYFTWAIGYAVQQGFTGTANKGTLLRDWKCKYITARMGTDDFPWQAACRSYMRMGTGTTWYANIAAVSAANNSAGVLALDVGTQQWADYVSTHFGEVGSGDQAENYTALLPNEMTAYGHEISGRPNEGLLAVVTAVDANVAGGELAWHRYSSRTGGPTLAQYASNPRFALAPYSKSRTVTTPMQMAALPAYVTAMAANSWKAISTANGFTGNLKLSQVYGPDHGWGTYYTPDGVMAHFCGGAYDWINHQIVVGPGGGHNGHYGNDVYTFGPLTGNNPQWICRREMSTISPSGGGTTQSPSVGGIYPDGRPAATHSYSLGQFDPITQQHIHLGSGSHFSDSGSCQNVVYGFRLNPTDVGVYDFDMGHLIIPGLGSSFDGLQGGWTAMDSINCRDYIRIGNVAGLKKYNPSKKTWVADYGNNDGAYLDIDATAAIHPNKRYMISIGGYSGTEHMQFWNIDTGARTEITNVSAPADTNFFWFGPPQIRAKTGFCFHPPSGLFVAYSNNNIWVLTPPVGLNIASPNALTWTWVKKTPTGDTTTAEEGQGTYNRFQWIPELNCFFVVNHTVDFCFLYKPDF